MKGRSDDMIILKGVNIFPIQIETVLLQFKELGSDYLITLETMESNDEMTIEVELSQLFTDDYARLQALTREITAERRDTGYSASKTCSKRLFTQVGRQGCESERLT